MILGGGTLPGSDGGLSAPTFLGSPSYAWTSMLVPPSAYFVIRPLGADADRYGAVSIPLVAPAAGASAADPCLDGLLEFLAAFLQEDPNVSVAWNAAGVAPTLPVVKTTHAVDPSEVGHAFSSNDLPALYLWRGSEMSRIEQLADCWRVETTKLKLLWIPPNTKRAISTVRDTIFNGIAKAIDVAIERGCTPSLVFEGDNDPRSRRFGSSIYASIGVVRVRVEGWKKAEVHVLNSDGSRAEPYTGIEATIHLEEKFDFGLGRFAPNRGVQITMLTGDPEVTFAGVAPTQTPPATIPQPAQPVTYFGAGAPGSTGAAFILSLGEHVSLARPDTFTTNAPVGSGLKTYYATPTRLGAPTFTVDGFAGGFARTQNGVSVTDRSGITDTYDLWESDYVDLGLLNVEVT